jgi:hypothetical protein
LDTLPGKATLSGEWGGIGVGRAYTCGCLLARFCGAAEHFVVMVAVVIMLIEMVIVLKDCVCTCKIGVVVDLGWVGSSKAVGGGGGIWKVMMG